jgi:hypothetical protein
MDQESDHNEEEKDHIAALEPGAAGRKMQQLAIEIYESTPKIVERKSLTTPPNLSIEFPKHASKILANMKRDTDDDKGQVRAALFLSSESAKLVKHGRIQNKDLAIEVCA